MTLSSPATDDRRSALARADLLLGAFDAVHPTLSLPGLAARTGLPRTSVRRTVIKLVELNWLERRGDRFAVGSKLFEVGGLCRVQNRLRAAALPHLEDLYEATHQTVHLGVLRGDQVLYVEKLAGHRPATRLTRVGGRMPAHCTAIGKVLTAYSGPTAETIAARRRTGPRAPDRRSPPGPAWSASCGDPRRRGGLRPGGVRGRAGLRGRPGAGGHRRPVRRGLGHRRDRPDAAGPDGRRRAGHRGSVWPPRCSARTAVAWPRCRSPARPPPSPSTGSPRRSAPPPWASPGPSGRRGDRTRPPRPGRAAAGGVARVPRSRYGRSGPRRRSVKGWPERAWSRRRSPR